MRHLKKGRKFSRVRKTRKALIKSLLRSLVERERIETTLARAKEARIYADKMVTKAKKGSLSSAREMRMWLTPAQISKVKRLALAMKDRSGGYTRIIRTKNRQGDAADMAVIEFVDSAKNNRTS